MKKTKSQRRSQRRRKAWPISSATTLPRTKNPRIPSVEARPPPRHHPNPRIPVRPVASPCANASPATSQSSRTTDPSHPRRTRNHPPNPPRPAAGPPLPPQHPTNAPPPPPQPIDPNRNHNFPPLLPPHLKHRHNNSSSNSPQPHNSHPSNPCPHPPTHPPAALPPAAAMHALLPRTSPRTAQDWTPSALPNPPMPNIWIQDLAVPGRRCKRVLRMGARAGRGVWPTSRTF